MTNYDMLPSHLQAILLFIQQYIEDNGYAPSVREIGKARNISSSSTVHGYLKRLEESGLLRRDAAKPRAMVVQMDNLEKPSGDKLPEDSFEPFTGHSEKPFFDGNLKKLPFVAFDGKDGTDDDSWLIPAARLDDGDYFLTRMPDDTMHNRQLSAGDLLIIRRQNSANNSDIILGQLGSETFVRTYSRGLRQVRLQAEHDDSQDPIEAITVNADELEILGKVVGFIHML